MAARLFSMQRADWSALGRGAGGEITAAGLSPQIQRTSGAALPGNQTTEHQAPTSRADPARLSLFPGEHAAGFGAGVAVLRASSPPGSAAAAPQGDTDHSCR